MIPWLDGAALGRTVGHDVGNAGVRGVRGPRGIQVLISEPGAQGIVLVHGSMDRASSFRRLMARLANWQVVAYDRRGYAGSSSLGPPTSFEDQVEDLLAVISETTEPPVVAFGHSFGGDVVLAAAAHHPELIRAAVVWEPPQPWQDWWPSDTAGGGGTGIRDPAELAEWFMRRMVGDRVWERLPETTREQRRREGETLAAEMNSIRDHPPFDPSRVGIPVVVGRGSASRAHQRRSARELASALRYGRLAEIPGTSHGVHLSHPTELAHLIQNAAAG